MKLRVAEVRRQGALAVIVLEADADHDSVIRDLLVPGDRIELLRHGDGLLGGIIREVIPPAPSAKPARVINTTKSIAESENG